jgi:hypothetical protein
MDEQNKQIANFLMSLIANNCTIPASQAESIVATKQWLNAIANGTLKVEPGADVPVQPEDQAEAA